MASATPQACYQENITLGNQLAQTVERGYSRMPDSIAIDTLLHDDMLPVLSAALCTVELSHF